MWHHCEEAHGGGHPWQPPLNKYYEELLAKFPANDREITKYYLLCREVFPIYLGYWANHETTVGCKPIFEEKGFKIPYSPSLNWQYTQIQLRGKIDRAFTRNGAVWLQENKTKGDIDCEGIAATVDQNLQTSIYHIALRELLRGNKQFPPEKIAGTLYNVVRRPLGDRFALRQGKNEDIKTFVNRVGKKIESEPERHFFRWLVPLSDRHLDRFKRESLNPILISLVRWWESIKDDPFNPRSELHYRFPFGVFSGLTGGYRGDYFRLLTTGSRAGLVKIDSLFSEI
jgi:hypothetical protein